MKVVGCSTSLSMDWIALEVLGFLSLIFPGIRIFAFVSLSEYILAFSTRKIIPLAYIRHIKGNS